MKLKNAAQATAACGLSTRVETTVATELAASWKPLRKSNASAKRISSQTVSDSWANGTVPKFSAALSQKCMRASRYAASGSYDPLMTISEITSAVSLQASTVSSSQ